MVKILTSKIKFSPKYSFIIALALTLLLSSCERKYYPKAHYLDGYLHTPWGKFKFQRIESKQQASDMHLYHSFDMWPGYLCADAGEVFVVLSFNGDFNYFFADRESRYGRKNYRLNIVEKETKYLSKDSEYLGEVLRGNLVDAIPSSGWDNFHGTGFKRQSSGQDFSPHRIVIPFNLSGDDFLIDVLVKSSWTGYWEMDIGPAGMP